MTERRNTVSASSRLGQLAEIQMGYPFRTRLEHDPNGDVAVIQMKDIDDANLIDLREVTRVNLSGNKSRHLLRPGDLLFRSRGRSNGVAQVPKGIATAVLAAPMLLIRPRIVLPGYLSWFLNAPATQAQLASVAEGTSVRMISAVALKALVVPVPSPATQHRIAEAAALVQEEQSLRARIASLRQQLTQHLLMKSAHEAQS